MGPILLTQLVSMKNFAQILLFAFQLIICVDLFVGCSPNSSSRNETTKSKASDTAGPNSPSPTASGPPSGTADPTGGGNGLDGKVYEAYIRDVTKEPAFKKYVLPSIEKFSSSMDGKALDMQNLRKSLAQKTWYFAPIDFKTIDKEKLGISFQAQETEQLAIQTINEIWIDVRRFDKSSLADQGTLLRHEIILMMYLYKFKSFAEMAKGSESLADSSEAEISSIDKLYPAEKLRPLNEKDYQNIRAMTNWYFLEGPKSKEDYYNYFRMYEFDSRIFANKNQIEKQKPPESISAQEYITAVQSSEMTGYPLQFCKIKDQEEFSKCSLTMKLDENKILHLKISQNKKSVDLRVWLNDKITLTPVFYPKKPGAFYATSAYLSDDTAKTNRGDIVHGGFAYLEKIPTGDKFYWQLHSITVVPGVITSVGKESIPTYKVQKVKPKDLNTSIFLISKGQDETPWQMFFFPLETFLPTVVPNFNAN